MISRHFIPVGLLAVAMVSGCASGAETTADPAAKAEPAEQESAAADADATSADPASADPSKPKTMGEDLDALTWSSPKGEVAGVSSVRFSDSGVVWIGFDDATVARAEGGKSTSRKVLDKPQPVIAVSPHGRVAMVRSDPGQMIRIDDQKTILRMNDVEGIESATFSRDGKIFFVAEDSGKLHIWRGGDQLYTLPDETVQKFIDRQLPDFTAHFDSIRGPVATTKPIRVAVGNSKGEILWWDPRTPNKVEWISKLDSPVRSMGIVGDYVVATSEKDKLGVASRPEQMIVKWARDAKAQWVATSPAWDDRFVEIADGTLGVRTTEDGSYKWQVKLPAGEVCGLEASADASRLAICIDDVIAIVDTNTRKVLGTLHRSGDALEAEGF